MILGFKQQFKEPILAGTKIHTIRKPRKGDRQWQVGDSIQMATGVRSKNYNCFKEAVCLGVQNIEIVWTKPSNYNGIVSSKMNIIIDGYDVSDQVNEIATNDGFLSLFDFSEWFDEDFEGQIIHWTDLKY